MSQQSLNCSLSSRKNYLWPHPQLASKSTVDPQRVRLSTRKWKSDSTSKQFHFLGQGFFSSMVQVPLGTLYFLLLVWKFRAAYTEYLVIHFHVSALRMQRICTWKRAIPSPETDHFPSSFHQSKTYKILKGIRDLNTKRKIRKSELFMRTY